MAVVARGFSKHLLYPRNVFRYNVLRKYCLPGIGTTEEFKEYQFKTEHNRQDYAYEVSKDPAEWAYIEKLMPLETVPPVLKLPEYSSGWRPQTAKPNDHPYFVERTRNHMLPIYLVSGWRGAYNYTKIRYIRGDIWAFHEELHKYVEEKTGKVIHSMVREGSNEIRFHGDVVYYCEQWVLSKGF